MTARAWALACVTLLTACGPGKSNLAPPTPLTDFTPAAPVERLWSADVGKGDAKKFLVLAPALYEERLYAADIEGHVTAYAAANGRALWSVEVGEPIGAPVGFGEGLVLVGSKNAHVFALGADDGKLQWRGEVSSEILGRPAAGAGVVVVQTIDGRVFGLSARDGRRLWVETRTEPALSLRGTGSPLIVGKLVLAGFANGKLLAAELDTGRAVWERTVAEARGRNEVERLVDVDSPPLASGNLVFAVSYRGRIVALQIGDGRILWVREVSSYSGMAADQTNLYISDATGNVLAMDQRTGAVLWQQAKLRHRLPGPPALVGGYLAVGDFEGYVHWLSPDSGAFVARARIGRVPIRGPGAVRGDTLFLQDQEGTLAALRVGPERR